MNNPPAPGAWYPPLDEAVRSRLDAVERDNVVARIWARDHTVWSSDPTEIADRLGWLTAPTDIQAEVPRLLAFAEQAWSDGYTTAVLLGMGGSSLAPEVMQTLMGSAPGAVELVVLDTTSPRQILDLGRRLDMERTLFIVSSKSGSTIETLSQFEYFWAKRPLGKQFIAITDAGSTLHRLAQERAFREVFLNPADVGGRYSGLTLFGLVPAALLGVDIGAELERAESQSREPRAALLQGVRMGEAALAGFDKFTLRLPPRERPFGWWAEQMLAESTGKDGRGLLPVEGEPVASARCYARDRLFVGPGDTGDHPVIEWSGWRGFATFWEWAFATAIAGYVLGINPFDQGSVQEAKDATDRILAGATADAATTALADTLATVAEGDYIALLAYLPRTHANDTRMARVRSRLLERYSVATTAGFGPRYLHSTGQYHKDGPNTGVFIQIVEPHSEDMAIPGAPFTFGELHDAQALGDLESLRSRQRRISRVSFDKLEAFVATL